MTNAAKMGLCIGSAFLAGMVVGMLFSPSRGSELRQQLKDKAGDILDKGKGLVSKGKGKMETLQNELT